MNHDVAIKVENVSKKFVIPTSPRDTIKSYFLDPLSRQDSFEVEPLKNISFNVKQGEFFSVIGRNGAGKSTLLKIVSSVYEADSGKVQVNGSLVPFLELGVGFSPELTARENIFLNGVLLGLRKVEVQEYFDEIIEFAELKDFVDIPVKKFSSGMYVRLAFSIAIRVRSDILVLDEVLAVGDAGFQNKCHDYFKSIKGKKAVMFVSHDLGAVEKYSDRVMVLKNDCSFVVGDPSKIIREYTSEVT